MTRSRWVKDRKSFQVSDVLEDVSPLNTAVEDGSLISLVVQRLDGSECKLENMSTNTSVAQLKAHIAEVLGVTPPNQRLIKAYDDEHQKEDDALPNEFSLARCHISDGDVILCLAVAQEERDILLQIKEADDQARQQAEDAGHRVLNWQTGTILACYIYTT